MHVSEVPEVVALMDQSGRQLIGLLATEYEQDGEPIRWSKWDGGTAAASGAGGDPTAGGGAGGGGKQLPWSLRDDRR